MHTKLGHISQNIVFLCRHSWQKLYGLGHTRIDNIKNAYIKNPDLLFNIDENKNCYAMSLSLL